MLWTAAEGTAGTVRSASPNRINLEQNGDSVNDYAFDASGNTTKDADGRTFVYDAENKQIEVKNASDETIGKYWYDGDGRRVKKRGWINGQWEETICWLSCCPIRLAKVITRDTVKSGV